jgi:2-aminoethylphosphonate-pyruvate transaminase
MPADPRFVFEDFYGGLRARGYLIYPGKLTVAPSFRIGCIGRIGAAEIEGALVAIRATLSDLGVADGHPDS